MWFGCDAGKMIDKKTGIMDDNTFNVSHILNTSYLFSKGEQLEYHQSEMNHAMLIIGIILKDQKVVGFKVEDSHGNQVGKDGYFYMSIDWFEKYVYQVVIVFAFEKYICFVVQLRVQFSDANVSGILKKGGI